MPTPEELNRARQLFESHEPRDLFYRLALHLLERARDDEGEFSVVEAVAVVLQTWNKRFSISTGIKFDAQHCAHIESLLERHGEALVAYSQRSVESLREDEQQAIQTIFNDFDIVVGPVGAAKALHVLAPRFFPLWDRPIAEGAGYYLDKRGTNANRYWRWMLRTLAERSKLAARRGGDRACSSGWTS
jgi:hypothetical protein